MELADYLHNAALEDLVVLEVAYKVAFLFASCAESRENKKGL